MSLWMGRIVSAWSSSATTVLRPAVSEDRLRLTEDGRDVLEMRRRGRRARAPSSSNFWTFSRALPALVPAAASQPNPSSRRTRPHAWLGGAGGSPAAARPLRLPADLSTLGALPDAQGSGFDA
jgi:hypothetical protein